MTGRIISHYRVLEQLGCGGMGVVYRAVDIRLGRHVALKFLPPELMHDSQALERFQREARAASALNHPRICAVYEFDEDGGQPFLVMEWLDGETLKRRVAAKPLEPAEVLDFGDQIADGLSAAHAAGIVHRDIKPANIFVTRRCQIKLMDFGLAKIKPAIRAGAPESSAETADLTNSMSTASGVIVGTVDYMSPEQARGELLDARTDLFSFGVVLYEMAAGVRPFSGETAAAVFDSILNRSPVPLSRLKPELPSGLERVVTKALEKDADLRYQSADDIRTDLKRLKRDWESGSGSEWKIAGNVATPTPTAWSWRWSVAALILATTLVVLALYWGRSLNTRTRARNPIFTQLTDQAGPEFFPSLSPDGRSFVYAGRSAGKWDIYLQRVGGKNAINLTRDSPADSTQPAFSPDGERIAFRSTRDGGGVFVMGATGESVRRLWNFGCNPSWSPDGARVVVATESVQTPESRSSLSQLWILDLAAGTRRRIAPGDAVQPQWSPHGYRIAYWANRQGQRDIFTVGADPGEPPNPVSVTNDVAVDWNPVWSPDGKFVYFSSDRAGSFNLWRVAIDERTGRVLGQPETVTTPSAYAGHISFSRDGRRFTYANLVRTRHIESVAFDPVAEEVNGERTLITKGTRMDGPPDISPDGRHVVFATAGHQEDLFVVGVDGSGLRQLTDDVHKDRAPRWSPDGKQIAFYSNRGGKYDLWVINVDGGGLRRLNTAELGNIWYPVWSPDGARLTFFFAKEDRSYLMVPGKPGTPETVQPLAPPLRAWSWSPDGRRIAGYRRNYEGSGDLRGVGVYSIESGQTEWLTENGEYPAWLPDSRRLMFTDGDTIRLLDTKTKNAHDVLSLKSAGVVGFSLARDGRLICLGVSQTEADIWLGTLN